MQVIPILTKRKMNVQLQHIHKYTVTVYMQLLQKIFGQKDAILKYE